MTTNYLVGRYIASFQRERERKREREGGGEKEIVSLLTTSRKKRRTCSAVDKEDLFTTCTTESDQTTFKKAITTISQQLPMTLCVSFSKQVHLSRR